MIDVRELWDVGEVFERNAPNLSVASAGRVMRALLSCQGKLHDSHVFDDDGTLDRHRYVTYRISLPFGMRERFEEICGYKLSRPPIVKGS